MYGPLIIWWSNKLVHHSVSVKTVNCQSVRQLTVNSSWSWLHSGTKMQLEQVTISQVVSLQNHSDVWKEIIIKIELGFTKFLKNWNGVTEFSSWILIHPVFLHTCIGHASEFQPKNKLPMQLKLMLNSRNSIGIGKLFF